MLTSEAKLDLIKKHGRNDKDTGSPEVQISFLTGRIKYLTDHFKTHKKDFNSRRGLLRIVGRRRRLLNYLKRTDLEKYRDLIKTLGIRK